MTGKKSPNPKKMGEITINDKTNKGGHFDKKLLQIKTCNKIVKNILNAQ